MTVARVLKQRGELIGPPAVFWVESRPAEELYELHSDPEEVNNLVGNSAHAQSLSQLRNELDRWMLRTSDQGNESEIDLKQKSTRAKIGIAAR